ncbi:lysozyme inhibitor LprI family protein [Comamonas aquatica]|uniref:lysozyme inhibitor LprI family protein n=1 Tax=Comamonas aquatica TaxID=225991 RepID=UPI0009DD1074
MKKSQRAWLQYREARCSFEALGPVAPGGAASQSLCMLEMTAQKADYLRDLLP